MADFGFIPDQQQNQQDFGFVPDQSVSQPPKEQQQNQPAQSDYLSGLKQGLTDLTQKYPFIEPALRATFGPMGQLARPSIIEPVATMASSMVAEPVSGLVGMATAPVQGAEQATKNIQQTQDVLTYKPKTTEGQTALKGMGELLAPVADVLNKINQYPGKKAYELTNSPLAGAIGETIIPAVTMLIGLKGLKSIRKGTQLIDDAGRPTPALNKALERKGLTFDDLTPQAKAAIPKTADPGFSPGANKTAQQAEKIVADQLKSGARTDSLATLKLSNGQVVTDTIGQEAVKQGFQPGVVQMIKTTTPQTKSDMLKMTRIMRQVKKNSSVSSRPSDIAGQAITKRIEFIRDGANRARSELNHIADTQLAGKPIDVNRIENALQTSLKDLDVTLDYKNGIPKPNYVGSMISKDRTSQRIINNLVDLLSENKAPDALRAHKLKRQLDIMIDFNKKSSQGLTDAGKNVLKNIRHELNQSIRDISPDYARVNDTLSESIDTLNSLDNAVGTIDIFGKGADKALGTRMRALLSNQQGRIKIENALDNINQTAANLGGKFDTNLRDLVVYADALDNKFGAVARTSLAGEMEKSVSQALREGPKQTIFNKGIEMAGKATEKARGINDYNAFNSLENLLK